MNYKNYLVFEGIFNRNRRMDCFGMGAYGKTVIHLIFSFGLKFRRTENYIHVLRILRKEWEKRGQLKIQRIHCDYEQAENNAVKAVFGEKFLFGCLFHFVKAALLHMRKEMPNMFRLYIHEKRIKGEFWKWVVLINC